MGGSGGRSYSQGISDSARIREEIREELRKQEINAELDSYLAEQLALFNDRDIDAVRDRLDGIEELLGEAALDVDRLLFGGSVAKHTYVDGLSDVDALVVLNDAVISPNALVNRFAEILTSRLGQDDLIAVEAGALAVTLTYRDGGKIQLLPAVERNGRTSIASEDGSTWRSIRPHKFAEKLTQINQKNGRAVVPCIKLAKAAISTLAENQRLSGYHIEAIAVDAFRDYSGRRDRVSMLRHLIDHAATSVLRPTGDITGQSVHVDAHLGPANSGVRRSISTSLSVLSSRLGSATSREDYRRIFDA